MCGIAGRFLKDQKLEADLGGLLAGMLSPLSELAPDPAGFAVDGAKRAGHLKLTSRGSQGFDFDLLLKRLRDAIGKTTSHRARGTRLVLAVLSDRDALPAFPEVTVVGSGRCMELFTDDLTTSPVRELTHAHHYLPLETNETDWRALNPRVKQTTARVRGKSHVHTLEPEDLVAPNVEAAAMERVSLAGTDQIPGGGETELGWCAAVDGRGTRKGTNLCRPGVNSPARITFGIS